MRFFMNVVHFSRECRRAKYDVADSRLAARIRMAVEQCEQEGQYASMLMFAGKEDPFPWHEAVVKNHIGIGRARHEPAFKMFPWP
jgi:hypothetical protein